jgi:hypothetical protein
LPKVHNFVTKISLRELYNRIGINRRGVFFPAPQFTYF